MKYSEYKEAKEVFNNIVKDGYGKVSKYDMKDFIEWAINDKEVKETGYQLGNKNFFPFDISEMIRDYIESQNEFYIETI